MSAVGTADGVGIDVHMRGVVHLYPSIEGDVVALKGVDLDVSGGESVSLIGPSGAGKSTVLGLLAGLFKASAGEVMVGAHNMGRLDAGELARLRATAISLVVQGVERNLVPYATSEQNIWFAQQGVRRRGHALRFGPRELLDLFGLAGVGDVPVGQLAAGQRQLVALAAGIAPMPKLLLVDEPTSRLDRASGDQVVDMILRICAELGTTVIIVTHDLEVGARMGRTVTIRDGRVGAEGRQGVDYTVIGRDGLLQLPANVFDVLPPNSLVEVVRRPGGVELRKADQEG